MNRLTVFLASFRDDLSGSWNYSALRRDVVRGPIHLQTRLMMNAHGTVNNFAVQEFDPVMAERAATIVTKALGVLFEHLRKPETASGERD